MDLPRFHNVGDRRDPIRSDPILSRDPKNERSSIEAQHTIVLPEKRLVSSALEYSSSTTTVLGTERQPFFRVVLTAEQSHTLLNEGKRCAHTSLHMLPPAHGFGRHVHW